MLRLQRRTGSASIWLHLGALGPKRVVGSRRRHHAAATLRGDRQPAELVRALRPGVHRPAAHRLVVTASDERARRCSSVDGDVDALAEVMRRGWPPQALEIAGLLAGESPAPRAARRWPKAAGLGVALSGLILVSCAMDLQSVVFAPRNDLPYALFLPAFANVAQYPRQAEGTQAESPAAARAAAEAFVQEDYLGALHAGARLVGRQREAHRGAHGGADRARAGAGRGEEPPDQRQTSSSSCCATVV